jgi:predicted DNA-binding protein (MmcQ/YjbR family)
MNIEQFRDFCLHKKGVTEHFPFDEVTLVFKVMGKIFALTALDGWEKGKMTINLKCDPVWAEALRIEHEEIRPGWHMNKRHWNTIHLNRTLSEVFAFQLISHSYEQVVSGLTKKKQEELKAL